MPVSIFSFKESIHSRSRAIDFLECYQNKLKRRNQELLTPSVLLKALSRIAGIDGWIPMSSLPPMPRQGYVSWLGKWSGKDYPPSIAVALPLFSEKYSKREKHAVYTLLKISLHEVGHEYKRDPSRPRKFRVLDGAAQQETRDDEVRAWFFAFCICGFLMAEIAGATVPDRVPEYLFHDA